MPTPIMIVDPDGAEALRRTRVSVAQLSGELRAATGEVELVLARLVTLKRLAAGADPFMAELAPKLQPEYRALAPVAERARSVLSALLATLERLG